MKSNHVIALQFNKDKKMEIYINDIGFYFFALSTFAISIRIAHLLKGTVERILK
jgi:hypothetical protein